MDSKGFTLIELIITLSILGILSLIAIPRFLTVTENARREVCEANRAELEHGYEIYLVQNDKTDTDANFITFVNEYDQEICPEGGVVSRSEGRINCSIHFDEEVEDSDEDEEVPFL
jgi:prepilin-type N-terminal cleavage/methylation domain-containing protein